MKHNIEIQIEQDLELFSSMKKMDAPNYFYTRLKARMENEASTMGDPFTLKPVIIICALTLFLFINSWLLQNDTNLMNTNANQNIEALATAYDQTITN
jgi:hypothetical protein